MSQERFIIVDEDHDGQRFDRWLKKVVPDIPFGLSQKLIRKGAFRIDGKKAKADTKLSAGQEVRIPALETSSEQPKRKPKLLDEDIAFMRSLVIHDDGDVIAINKPHGLASQGGTNTKRHIDGMLDALANKDGVRPRLVHRLDKDTSGVMLLARSAKVAKALGQQFKSREMKKIYWALLSPAPEEPRGAIKAPLAKAGGTGRERMVIDEDEGKFALTEYEVLEHAADKVAFVAFWPRTGRTHQIRAHAEIMGCPIIGDPKYKRIPVNVHDGNPDEVQGVEGIDRAERLHLHAQRITCYHPTRRGMLDIVAPLPPELVKSWKALGFNPKNKDPVFEDIDG